MQMKKLLEKFSIVIILNLVIFVVLYFIWNHPLKKEYNYRSNEIIEYSDKINLTSLDPIFLKVLKNINLINNDYLLFDDDVLIHIAKNNFRKRGGGEINIWGEYKHNDDLEKFIREINDEINISDLIKNHRVVFYNNESTTCYLFIEPVNKIQINFHTRLPYHLNNDYESSDEFEKYYLSLNEQIKSSIKKQLRENYIKIFIIIIVFNSICLFLCFLQRKYKQNNCQNM